MKASLRQLKSYAIAGFTFLLPVFVILTIVVKAFRALKSTGARIAALFGHKTFFGMGAAPIITVVLLVVICLICGYFMVKYSFMKRVNKRIENLMEAYIPGYKNYKKMAEETFIKKEAIIPHTPAFLNGPDGSIRPVFIIEKNGSASCVIMIPEPATAPKGQVVIVPENLLTVVTDVTANEFNARIKSAGKGMLELHQKPNGQKTTDNTGDVG